MFESEEQIETRLYEIISKQFAIEKEKITPEMRFREELYADSLDIMELCDCLEGEFDLPTLKQDKIASIHKIADLIKLINPNYADNGD